MKSQADQRDDFPHVLFFVAVTLFPGTIAAILVYIVLRGFHSLAYRDDNDSRAKRARMACATISIAVGLVVQFAIIATVIAERILGISLF
jgi:archaellum biogenesis protein FlaJ (TadC family)